MGKFIDLTGQKYGELLVLHREDGYIDPRGKHRTMWRCLCSCGREKSIRMDALVSGKTKSCGMCSNDITGQKFGRLTPLFKNGVDCAGHQIWRCVCDCGNEIDVLATNLIQQYTQSCGCLHSEICSENGEDLIGQKFGKLTVINLVSISPRKYLCCCECGGQTIVEPGNLKNGHTKSCGCIMSLGQEKINAYLSANQIYFKPEYSVSIIGFDGLARFDFAILNNDNTVKMLLEYHGKQHYTVAHSWSDSEDKLLDRQRKDQLKREWANEHNIPLYEIPYWEFENIENILTNIIEEVQEVTE